MFLNTDDVNRCIEIVRKEFTRRGISINNNVLKKITEDIMNIS